MLEITDEIVKWPVIFQGALGSALFWLVLFVGQKIVKFVSGVYSHKSKEARRSWLISSQYRYVVGSGGLQHSEKAHYFAVLLYRSARHLYKSLMWLVLGLIADSFMGEIAVIGYLGALFYLFMAFDVVAPNNNTHEENRRKFSEVSDELDKLDST